MKPLFFLGLLAFLKGAAGNVPPRVDCPDSFVTFIGQNQDKAIITWNMNEVTAMDQEDGELTKVLDPLSPRRNSRVGPGQYVIRYSAKDKKGRSSSCEFIITVLQAQCPAIPNIQYGESTCRQGTTFGRTCTMNCQQGYEVLTGNVRTCQRNGSYTGQLPRCVKTPYYTRLCGNLTKASKDQFDNMVDATFTDLKTELIRVGSLSSFETLKNARKLCKDKRLLNHGSCVFIHRYDLFHLLRNDSAHKDDMYRYLMLTHPDIEAFCVEPTYKAKVLDTFPDIKRYNITAYQGLFKTTMELFIDTATANLRKESLRVCVSKKGTSCLLKDIFALVEHSFLFLKQLKKAESLGKWMNPDVRVYFNGLTFTGILLKWNYLKAVTAIRPTGNSDQQQVLIDILKDIARYVDKGQDDKLRVLPTMFPKVVTDKICNNGKMCLFWRVVDQTRMYVASRQPNTTKVVRVRVLDTSLDKREFLEQKQMERILQLLADGQYNLIAVAQDLKKDFTKTINKRFSELKSYFKKVQKFNAAKAKADMIVMKHLKEITVEAKEVAKLVDKNVYEMIRLMMLTLGLEMIGSAAKLSLTIAEHCNPLKDLIDASPSSLLDASSDLAQSIVKFAAGGALAARLSILQRQAVIVSRKFKKNQDAIEAMKVLMDGAIAGKKGVNFTKAKDKFVKSYTDFYPAIRKDEVVGLEAFFTNVMDTGCDLIANTKQLHSAMAKGYIGAKGICWVTKVKIAKLFTMYGSIFDKQFELIEVLMQNVQAQVGIEAADGILVDYTAVAKAPSESDDVLQKLQQLAGMSYVTYRLMVLQVIRLYCDELQYKNGDTRPSVCKDSSTDISLLLAYIEPRCSRKLEFQSVPTYPSGPNDTGYMKLKELYEGREISFQIPDSKWLYKYGWITKGGTGSVIYVTGIEIYLPSDVAQQRDIRVEMNVAGRNYLVPGATWYSLLPARPLVYSYMLGHSTNCRQAQNLGNPYSTCPTNKLDDICPQTEYACFLDVGKRALYPSIFSNFLIRVNGYEGIGMPNSTTPMNLKIGIRTCTYTSSRRQGDSSGDYGVQKRTSLCCTGNKYWSEKTQACTDCPPKSHVALNGYYCEKDK